MYEMSSAVHIDLYYFTYSFIHTLCCLYLNNVKSLFVPRFRVIRSFVEHGAALGPWYERWTGSCCCLCSVCILGW